jgi:NAD/NADP transhydrogenase alpha subunit
VYFGTTRAASVKLLADKGFKVQVEAGAGAGSTFTDNALKAAGAVIKDKIAVFGSVSAAELTYCSLKNCQLDR